MDEDAGLRLRAGTRCQLLTFFRLQQLRQSQSDSSDAARLQDAPP
jgi:hypothetical protein